LDQTLLFFLFQAEDGIRDFHVTGVQTCALPILEQLSPDNAHDAAAAPSWASFHLIYLFAFCITFAAAIAEPTLFAVAQRVNELRSEERRVGKGCSQRGWRWEKRT